MVVVNKIKGFFKNNAPTGKVPCMPGHIPPPKVSLEKRLLEVEDRLTSIEMKLNVMLSTRSQDSVF